MLADVFLSNARQKMLMLQRQEEASRMLSLSDDFVEEFTVAAELMGESYSNYGSELKVALPFFL